MFLYSVGDSVDDGEKRTSVIHTATLDAAASTSSGTTCVNVINNT